MQYFQGHLIIVKTNYLIKWILNKLNLAGKMVAWVVELFEYAITYTHINNIKSQVLVDFLIELSSPTPEEVPEHWIL